MTNLPPQPPAGETEEPAPTPETTASYPSVPATPVPLPTDVVFDTQTRRETAAVTLLPHWRRRRFLVTTLVFAILLLGLTAFVQTGTDPIFYVVLLAPIYAITLAVVLRKPKLGPKEKRTLADRLSWQKKLMISVFVFIALYLPFAFVSDRIIPYAGVMEFFIFALALFLLYRLVGRAVGVAPSVEALPPPSHRIHKQIVVPIDDPHYQRTLYLNFDFVDKGRGGKALARRLGAALESFGVTPERAEPIVEELEGYHEGWFSLGVTARGRERRRRGRERREQVLRRVYTKFNQELELTA